jgi:hypothetical protein
MHFFRSIHGAPTDPKWLVVARKAKVLPVHVAAVWWSLLDHASQNESRGSIEGFDPESIAAFFGMETEEVDAILVALEGKGLIEDTRIVKWEKHQPKREREDSSTERVREHRARKTGVSTPEEGVTREVTPCNATEPHETPSSHKTDRQRDKTEREKERQTETGETSSSVGENEKFIESTLSENPHWRIPLAEQVSKSKPSPAKLSVFRAKVLRNWLNDDGTPPSPGESPPPNSAAPPSRHPLNGLPPDEQKRIADATLARRLKESFPELEGKRQ